MSKKSETWNDQLREWYEHSGLTTREIFESAGLPRRTFKDYISGNIKNLDRLTDKNRKMLYELTGLDIFNPEDQSRAERKVVSRPGDDTSQLSGMQKLEKGLLQAQRYRPSAQQRTDAIMELLDVLSEEVDYFRTASEDEKRVLVKRLQREPESFGYVSQMLNVIYKGQKLDSWMLMAQPPSRLKRLR